MDTSNVTINDDETYDGHNVLYLIPVRILAAMKSEPFNVDYNINCHNLPTSWRLGITYEQKPETGNVSCFVTLSRTDVGNGNLNVFVLVSYVDDNGRFVRYPKLIGSGQVLAGGKVQGSVEESRYPGYRSYIYSLGLVLRVSMFVRNCHFGMKFHDKAYSSTDAKETHHSKI
ncbi:hypothetical protein AVEN_196620-1 [Araneus ventricosus]|uniref:Uncharacterized protein n=1 Tax=Araneus ventricosus TaxID=182803 RepID=A0A4Y2GTA5_ARAVE|nr:hypothetical protein AVEN_196620-1 [Araneus ventricosus]